VRTAAIGSTYVFTSRADERYNPVKHLPSVVPFTARRRRKTTFSHEFTYTLMMFFNWACTCERLVHSIHFIDNP
jgi:hypothetical protein